MNALAAAYGCEPLQAQAQFECKMCWTVCDPMNDDVWQMMPSKTYAQLPDYWRCPQCGNKKKDFLVLDD